ncbi:MAG: hypothetical protein Aurels2KO_26430 [Aureliella sp.]
MLGGAAGSRLDGRMKKLLIIPGALVGGVLVLIYFAYPLLDARYQHDMDSIRQDDAHQIAYLIREFADKTGNLPFQEQAKHKPFMVLIGHSREHEDHFANDPVLKRDAQWANSFLLESKLEKALGRDVQLPRDPQKVPTYAPNVYIYFVSGNQLTVVSHLHHPNDKAVKYEWNGNPFYSYTITNEFNPQRNETDDAGEHGDAHEAGPACGICTHESLFPAR